MSARRQSPVSIDLADSAAADVDPFVTLAGHRRPAAPRPSYSGDSSTADPHLLHPLECRLGRANSIADIYDLALGSARRRTGVRCALIVNVDSERLSLPTTGGALTAAGGREITEYLKHQPFVLSPDDRRVIDDRDDAAAGDAIERIVTARLGLPHIAVGRIKLEHTTVALLVIGHHSSTTYRDRIAAAEIAALTTSALQRTIDDFWRRLDATTTDASWVAPTGRR